MIPSWSRRIAALVGFIGAVLALVAVVPNAHAASPFTLFETGQVRPLALSPDGTRLFAVNTPDNRLEIFDVTGRHADARRLGAGRPRAGRGRGAHQHRGLGGEPPLRQRQHRRRHRRPATARVVRTLLVGDEPRDIVFAGPGGNRAFITTAHRGQNTPLHATIETVLTTAGHRPRRRLGLRRDQPRRHARRHAADDRHALRRHAARARRVAGRRHRLRRRLPLRQPHDDALRGRSCRTAARARAACRSRTTNFQSDRRPEVGLIVQLRRRALARRARPQLEQQRQVLAARQGRVRDRRQRQSAGARSPGRPASTPASARSSSTWSSTR